MILSTKTTKELGFACLKFILEAEALFLFAYLKLLNVPDISLQDFEHLTVELSPDIAKKLMRRMLVAEQLFKVMIENRNLGFSWVRK